MSNDTQKADQIAYRLFTKLTLVVHQARTTLDHQQRQQPKVDKWFNLETPDTDLFRDHLRIYRSISTTKPAPPPPLELQVLLVVPELANNQVLVYQAPDSSRIRVDPTPRFILLERWVLSFSPTKLGSATSGESEGDVPPSTIYKHGIPLFRSLFTLLRVLPAWKLFKRLRRRAGGGTRNVNLGIQIRVRERTEHVSASGELSSDDGEVEESDDVDEGILGFDTPPTRTRTPASSASLPTSTHAFPSIPHPMGNLALSLRYLTTPNFALDELESLLSDRFLSADADIDMDMMGRGGGDRGFTPTLVKNQQRDSMVSAGGGASNGSLPARTSLPRSPPGPPTNVGTSPVVRYPSSPASISTKTDTSDATIKQKQTVVGGQPSVAALADRFVLPSPTATPSPSPYTSPAASVIVPMQAHGRTTSLPQQPSLNLRQRALSRSPRGGNANLPLPGMGVSRPPSVTGAGAGSLSDGGSVGSTSVAARIRRQSGSGPSSSSPTSHLPNLPGGIGTQGSSAGGPDLPSSPHPLPAVGLPIRRPVLNPVHPFKASTLSPSPSLHSHPQSPSSLQSRVGGGVPSPLASPRPFPTAGGATSPTTARISVPPSPMRPSPPPQANSNSPFTPSSLGDRRSLASVEDEAGKPGQRKRYSSSFSKRYQQAGTGAAGVGSLGAVSASQSHTPGGSGGSDGSAEIGSLGLGLGQGPAGRFLGGGAGAGRTTDDDDISMYLQDIDTRKPLNGRRFGHERGGAGIGEGDEGEIEIEGPREREEETPIVLLSTEETARGPSTGVAGAMLTSESEVEERLRQMNQAFLRSLEGLGGDSNSNTRSSAEPSRRQSSSPGGLSDVSVTGRGRAFRPRLESLDIASRSTSGNDVVRGSTGSDEVIGRMSLDGDRRIRQ